MKKIIAIALLLAGALALASCANQNSKTVFADMFELSQKMLTADETLPIMMTVSSDEDNAEQKFKKHCDFDYSKVKSYFWSYEETGMPYEIAVIELKNESDSEALANSLKSHAKAIGADENKTEITSKGNYTALIICDQKNKVKEAFDKYVK